MSARVAAAVEGSPAADHRPEESMFFIVGRGRSGSTLLARMLDAHPAVAVAEEALFVVSLARRYRDGRWTEERVRRFSRDLWREERMRRWGLDRRALEEALVALAPDLTYARLCAEVYAASAAARGKGAARRLGDKNPHYALFVEDLARLFPRARFLFLLRDYRDNVLSYRRLPFDLSSTAALAERWRRYNQAVLRAERATPGRFLRVRFERLVAYPGTELRRICAFLGVEPTDEIAERRGPRVAVPWHADSGSPVLASRAGAWRRNMTPRQLALADAVCQPLADRLGYPAAPAGPLAVLGSRPGAAWGGLVTSAERLLFRFPVPLRARIIRRYRIATGNRIE